MELTVPASRFVKGAHWTPVRKLQKAIIVASVQEAVGPDTDRTFLRLLLPSRVICTSLWRQPEFLFYTPRPTVDPNYILVV